MHYEVRIQQVAPTPTAVVRRRAQLHELSNVVPQACGVVWAAIRSRSVQGAHRNVALYYDGQINLEAGVELDAGTTFVGDGDVLRSATPGGTVATAVHVGPYSALHEAHDAIRNWCADHRCPLAGPNWEIYDHWNEDQAHPRTDVFYLLRSTMAPVHRTGEQDDDPIAPIMNALRGVTRRQLVHAPAVVPDEYVRFGLLQRVTIALDSDELLALNSPYVQAKLADDTRRDPICPVCGGQAVKNADAVRATVEFEFERDFGIARLVWAHRTCYEACRETSEERGFA